MGIDYKRSVELSLADLGKKMTENRDLPRNDVLRLMMVVEYQIALFEEVRSVYTHVSSDALYKELHKILSMVL